MGNNAAAEERERRKQQVALGYRILSSQRWGDMGDGHISARDPERTDCFWLLGYLIPYNEATVKDLVLVGPDGKLASGEGFTNPAAYYIHHPILMARPDAVSAVHVHTHWGTPFSSEVRMLEPSTQEACAFYEDHALFDDEEVQVQDVEGGKRIAEALGDKRAVILRNHGLLTVGRSIGEAFMLMHYLERACRVQLAVLATGREVSPIPPAMLDKAAAQYQSCWPGTYEWPALVRLMDKLDPSYRE